MKKLLTLSLLTSLFFFFACNKDDDTEELITTSIEETDTITKGNVEFVFIPKIDKDLLVLGDTVITPAGEKLVVNDLKFFVSKIGLSHLDASEENIYPIEGDSNQVGIYLVDFSEMNFHGDHHSEHGFKFSCQAPIGEYADIRYQIGVPREYNLADISTNPYPVNGKNGMYWSWNSGFKFFVLNGHSPDAQGVPLHLSIGLGHRILDYNFRSMLLAESRDKIVVEEGKTTTLKFEFNLKHFLTNADGSHYSFTPASPSPAQVHGGEMSDILHANAATAMDLIQFETK